MQFQFGKNQQKILLFLKRSKMKTVKNIVLILFLTPIIMSAQDIEFKDYNWDSEPAYGDVELEEDEDQLILKQKHFIEYFVDEEGFFQYELRHNVIYVGSDKAVEENNKLYLPTGNVLDLIKQKARVISKTGEIQELDEDDILTSENENGSEYQYFALEGVEIGSRVEHLYLTKKYPDMYGRKIAIQGSLRKLDYSFELINPGFLDFKAKSYNGLLDLENDTIISEEKTRQYLNLEEVEKIEFEEQASNYANAKFLIYKIDKNVSKGLYDLTSYGEASNLIFKSVCQDLDKSTKKKLVKILDKEIGTTGKSIDEQVFLIEDYVKKNVQLIESNQPMLSNVSSVLETKFASEKGMTALVSSFLDMLDIDHQIVLTCDRDNLKFDDEFEAYIFLEEYLIYIDKTKKYLSPVAFDVRYGFAPSYLMHNNGLFIKKISIGDTQTGIGKVKFIESIDSKENAHDIYVNVDLSEDIFNPKFELKNEFKGYSSGGIQCYYELLDDDAKKEIRESYISFVSGESELSNVEIENASSKDFGHAPMVISGEFNSTEFTDKAGQRVLFKAGLLIGEQAEFYDKKDGERIQDLESDFNRSYHHEITIIIPEDYEVANLEEFIFDNSYSDESEIPFEFKSTAVLDGNVLKIVVNEHYDKIDVPADRFDEYKRVINAAANFNKGVLVFEKKS